jgi:hypothetical protein
MPDPGASIAVRHMPAPPPHGGRLATGQSVTLVFGEEEPEAGPAFRITSFGQHHRRCTGPGVTLDLAIAVALECQHEAITASSGRYPSVVVWREWIAVAIVRPWIDEAYREVVVLDGEMPEVRRYPLPSPVAWRTGG